jgi:hypothetical protein
MAGVVAKALLDTLALGHAIEAGIENLVEFPVDLERIHVSFS